MSKTRKINLKKVLSDKEKLKEAVLSEYCRMAFDDIGNYIEISKDEEGEIIVRYKEGKAFRTGIFRKSPKTETVLSLSFTVKRMLLYVWECISVFGKKNPKRATRRT